MTKSDHQSTDAEYQLLEDELTAHHVGNRTKSTALLAWFLEAVWRLEPSEVSDSICDGGGDKGIDALHVDEDGKEITVFQVKHRTRPHLTQGDVDFKNLVGSAAYLDSAQSVERLLQAGPNPELRNLVERSDLQSKLHDDDYNVQLVFVTNALLDSAGTGYVQSREGQSPPLDVWSRDRLAGVAARTARLRVDEQPLELQAVQPPLVAALGDDVKMLVGLVSAPDLVRLPGIEDLSIFELNVRLGLGRTRINKELAATINDPAEHRLFPAYHNGMTLLTRSFSIDGTDIELNGVSVVNGCQSLLALYLNRSQLTPDLQILIRIVELGEQGELVDRITYRTNNQNPVNLRDQRSTDKIQRDLQTQLGSLYGRRLGLEIRNGESVDADALIENSFLAQLVMATSLKEPWNAVRKVKLFDQEYHRIFNRHLNAHSIVMMHMLDESLVDHRDLLVDELNAAFSSVRFTLIYLLHQLIGLTPDGEAFLADPAALLLTDTASVEAAVAELAAEVIRSTNFYVEDMHEEAASKDELFDPKTTFKSRTGVRHLERDAIGHFRRSVRRDDSFGFRLSSTPPD